MFHARGIASLVASLVMERVTQQFVLYALIISYAIAQSDGQSHWEQIEKFRVRHIVSSFYNDVFYLMLLVCRFNLIPKD